MRVLVTGGAGFIGTNLIKRLIDDGNRVLSMDDYSTGKRENHLDEEENQVKYFKEDVSWYSQQMFDLRLRSNIFWGYKDVNYKTPKDQRQPDIIFHLSAGTQIPKSLERPRSHIFNNYMGVLNVLEYSRKNGNIPVVFAGSASRYGNVYDNPYAFSKYQGEQLCKMYSELYGVPTSVCRFFNVYGPNAPTEGQYVGVIGIFSRLFKEGRPLTITGDGTQTRDFIHVKDVVDGLVLCSNSYYARDNLHTTFDFGTGKSYSLNEIANAFGENYPSTYIDERRGEIKHSVCDPTFTKEELGWETKIDVIDYIKNTYNHG